jgi:hypothetical protein
MQRPARKKISGYQSEKTECRLTIASIGWDGAGDGNRIYRSGATNCFES